ncbi:MAG: WS/DGAT/MGAT family O-acyltransferase [Pseudomonadales bacterium]
MHRLSGQDAYFLYQETPNVLMHTMKISLCEQPAQAKDYQQTKRDIEQHLHLLPAFRRRIIPVPFGLHHPVVIEDPGFDINFHVRRVALPTPGGKKELDEMIALIGGYALDRSRPLWEAWLIEGLEDGRVAYVNKIHHAVADGVASAAFIGSTLVGTAEQEPQPEQAPWQAEAIPSYRTLLVDAFRDHLKTWARLPQLLRRSIQGAKAVKKRKQHAALQPPEPFANNIPKTRFNYALTAHRTYATVQHDIEQFKRIKNELGGTINDVVLAVTASAMRRYLQSHDELPQSPLVAAVPVSADDQTNSVLRMFGNNLAYFHTALRTDIADPLERYRATREVTNAAKEVLDLMGRHTAHDWMEFIPPPYFAWRKRLDYRLRRANIPNFPLAANMIVSNVPGPKEARYTLGLKHEALYSVGPLTEGIGLNLTVWSYAGNMNFGLIACKKAVPDLYKIADYISEALQELSLAAQQNGG